jgi:hypothetical protein
MGKVALGQVFTEYFGFPCQSLSNKFFILTITRGMYNRPEVADVPNGPSMDSTVHYGNEKKKQYMSPFFCSNAEYDLYVISYVRSRDYWVSEFWPSFSILKEHKVSEIECVSLLRWGSAPTVLRPLERANHNHNKFVPPVIWGLKQIRFPKRCVPQEYQIWTKSKNSVMSSVIYTGCIVL